MPDFKAHINRFGQHISVGQQEARYKQVLEELNELYGEGDTHETVTYDYRFVGKGKNKKIEKYVCYRETVNRVHTAKWHAENGY